METGYIKGKYAPDNPEGFKEPVLRCVECQKLNWVEDLRRDHTCICGCPRFRTVKALDDKEIRQMLKRKVDPEYLELFGYKATFVQKVRAYVGI